MRNKRNPALFVAQAGVIGALYVVLTCFVSAFNLASGAIQIRISEALTILPVFTPAAIPGLFIGCVLANAITGAAIYDVIFGSLTTLVAACVTYGLRKLPFVYTLPPVILNALVIPVVLIFAYHTPGTYLFLALTVGAGEAVSVCVLGFALKKVLDPYRNVIFDRESSDRVRAAE
ncbi:MAG: QueT transporter family protein [Lachnospiraceae bacterium]|nr:QueT transporter family protein [Lachnospiraceae bacterium]MBQ2576945.1 QueT transporter family protein [Lachnospiraceae bacterium]MCR4732470.1 QueT transporter family protein [Lachnospiraceae bacterium]MEE3355565.1 QueT transporter family protein [Candidatus Weimeria sp.]